MTAEKWYKMSLDMTYNVIARTEGVSKNTVIGAVARWRKRNSMPVMKRNCGSINDWLYGAKKKSVPLPVVDDLPALTLPSFEAVLTQNTCRYITGEGDDAVYCGHERRNSSSYCDRHHKVCYAKRV